jgi:uncharacterized protein YfcZ (UPF0381/DUF406 family)
VTEVVRVNDESSGWAGCECPGCGKALVMDLHDAGSCFYVGQVCDDCGEVGWLQGIYATRQEAEAALARLAESDESEGRSGDDGER